MRILVTMPVGKVRDTFIPLEIKSKLESLGEVEWNTSTEQFTKEQLKEKIKDVDVCLTGWGTIQFDGEVLESANSLKLVAHTGGTVAHIVSDELYEKGVKVISGNYYFAESVAEGVIAYILCALRRLPFYANELQQGRWKTVDYYNEGLLDQTVGLISFGMIPQCLVKMLQPFRAKIKVYSSHISDETLAEYGMERASMEEIFSTCKIISIHSALTPQTHHMINKELLQTIPEGSLFINTARGSVVDEEALAEELQKKRFNAVLDVFEAEPLPADSKLRGLDNVILIPHMGGPTIDRRKFVTSFLIDDIQNYFNGKSLDLEITQAYAARMTR